MSRSMDDRAGGKPLGEEWKAIKAAHKELADARTFPPVLDGLVKRMDEAVAKQKALVAETKKKDFDALFDKLRALEEQQKKLVAKVDDVRANETEELRKINAAYRGKMNWEEYTKVFADNLEEYNQLLKSLNDQIYVVAQKYQTMIRQASELAHKRNADLAGRLKEVQAAADAAEKAIRQAIIASEKIAVKAGATDAIDGLKALLGKL